MIEPTRANQLITSAIYGRRENCENAEERAFYDRVVKEQASVKRNLGPGVVIDHVNEVND